MSQPGSGFLESHAFYKE